MGPHVTVYLMAVLRRGLFVALHHALRQDSSIVCHSALPASLLGVCSCPSCLLTIILQTLHGPGGSQIDPDNWRFYSTSCV
ncbi:hypothetical protein PAMP_014714 [Pampus punctatissimus]